MNIFLIDFRRVTLTLHADERSQMLDRTVKPCLTSHNERAKGDKEKKNDHMLPYPFSRPQSSDHHRSNVLDEKVACRESLAIASSLSRLSPFHRNSLQAGFSNFNDLFERPSSSPPRV